MAGGGVVGAGVSGVEWILPALDCGLRNRRVVGQPQPSPDLEMQTVPMKSTVSQPDTETHNTVKEGGKSL